MSFFVIPFTVTRDGEFVFEKFISSVFCLLIYIYRNGRTDVYLSVGMWRANRKPNPCTDLDKILNTHPNLSKEGFGAGLTPTPPSWAGGGA